MFCSVIDCHHENLPRCLLEQGFEAFASEG